MVFGSEIQEDERSVARSDLDCILDEFLAGPVEPVKVLE
jgi:hypothetical protein